MQKKNNPHENPSNPLPNKPTTPAKPDENPEIYHCLHGLPVVRGTEARAEHRQQGRDDRRGSLLNKRNIARLTLLLAEQIDA